MPAEFRAYKVAGVTLEIDKRYSDFRPIGNGAYGVVISALDTQSNTRVAIKKIPRAFEDLVDGKRILREIKLLRHFKHENIISILDIFPPPSYMKREIDDVYIVSDLMETDLHKIIYSRQPLSVDHAQYFVYQILRALKFMHSAKVIHRDLKPSNLLCNSNCDLKICDLGLARGLKEKEKAEGAELTEYVVTRWYRAPEVMLACQEYAYAIDVWGVGCIFAELLARKPIFPGEDYVDQIRVICDKIGKPASDDLSFVTSEKARKFIQALPEKENCLQKIFPQIDSEAVDLLSKMLVFNPAKRIAVNEALKHPFMASLHAPEDEPVAEQEFSFSYENETVSKEKLQDLMWNEVLHFHPDAEEYSAHLIATGQKAPPVDVSSIIISPRCPTSLQRAFYRFGPGLPSAVGDDFTAKLKANDAQTENHNLGARSATAAELDDAETPVVKRPRPGEDRPRPSSPGKSAADTGDSNTSNTKQGGESSAGASVQLIGPDGRPVAHPFFQMNRSMPYGADPRLQMLAIHAATQHQQNLEKESPNSESKSAASGKTVPKQSPGSDMAAFHAHWAQQVLRSQQVGAPGDSTRRQPDLASLYAMQAQQPGYAPLPPELMAYYAAQSRHQGYAAHMQMRAHAAQMSALKQQAAIPPPGSLGAVMSQHPSGMPMFAPGGQNIFSGLSGQGKDSRTSRQVQEMIDAGVTGSLPNGNSSPFLGAVNSRVLGSLMVGPGSHGANRLGATLGVNIGSQLGQSRFSNATNPFSTSNMNRRTGNFSQSEVGSSSSTPETSAETMPVPEQENPSAPVKDSLPTNEQDSESKQSGDSCPESCDKIADV